MEVEDESQAATLSSIDSILKGRTPVNIHIYIMKKHRNRDGDSHAVMVIVKAHTKYCPRSTPLSNLFGSHRHSTPVILTFLSCVKASILREYNHR